MAAANSVRLLRAQKQVLSDLGVPEVKKRARIASDESQATKNQIHSIHLQLSQSLRSKSPSDLVRKGKSLRKGGLIRSQTAVDKHKIHRNTLPEQGAESRPIYRYGYGH